MGETAIFKVEKVLCVLFQITNTCIYTRSPVQVCYFLDQMPLDIYTFFNDTDPLDPKILPII